MATAEPISHLIAARREAVRGVRLDGETWAEWAGRLFETEYCAECGGDIDVHVPVILNGHWFALCEGI